MPNKEYEPVGRREKLKRGMVNFITGRGGERFFQRREFWGGVGAAGLSAIASVILDQPIISGILGGTLLAIGTEEAMWQCNRRMVRRLFPNLP